VGRKKGREGRREREEQRNEFKKRKLERSRRKGVVADDREREGKMQETSWEPAALPWQGVAPPPHCASPMDHRPSLILSLFRLPHLPIRGRKMEYLSETSSKFSTVREEKQEGREKKRRGRGHETKGERAEARESKRIERVAGTARAHTTDANRNTPHRRQTEKKNKTKKEREG